MKSPMQIGPWIPCGACGDSIHIDNTQIIAYFAQETISCVKCRHTLDWWSTVCRAIEQNFMFNQAFAFIGARTVIFRLRLTDGHNTVYRFSDYGIPNDAKILYVNYTPVGGGLFPLEMHGNIPTRRFFTNEVVVYPVRLRPDEPMTDTEVNVMVSWVPPTANDESWQSLVDAFEAYAHARYSSMIIPANVAVESALSRVLTTYLVRFTSKKHTEEFLENAATYGYQLNVLVPVFASLNSLSLLPDHVRGSLNRLRSCRNELAHAGTLNQPLNQHDAAELLCGALFGFHYVRHIEDQLLRA